MTYLPKHKPIHIHSFIYYTSLMLLNFHSLEEVWDFLLFLKKKYQTDQLENSLLSESSLQKDWLRAEEDEAWQHL